MSDHTNQIRVSVIIPCYNVEDCLQRSVDSVLSQTHKNIELILVDNNSTDGTWQLMQDLESKHPFIKIEKQTKKGPCPTRNKGFGLATGKWIQFLDADDIIQPEKIAYQLEVAEESKLLEEEAIVVGQKQWNRVDGTIVQNILSEDKWRDLIHGRLGDTCANLWSYSIIKKINGWNEDLPSSTEIDLQFRALKNNAKVVYDKKPLTIIYERPSGSITRANPLENIIRVIRQRMDIRKYLYSREDLHKYIAFIDYFIFNNLKLVYAGGRDEFDKIYEEVLSAGFDVTKNKEELSSINRFLIKLFGLKGYLKFLTITGRIK